MIFYLLLAAIALCIVMSLKTLFTPGELIDKMLTIRNLVWLAILYGTITLGFGLIYLLLELKDIPVLLEMGGRMKGDYLYKLETTIYFSSITFFSVGYGDLIPIGIGRIISSIQAFIGYTLPAAFVVRAVIHYEQQEHKK